MRADVVMHTGRGALACVQHFVLQAGCECSHTFALSVLGQEGLAFASGCFGLLLCFGLHTLADDREAGVQGLGIDTAFGARECIANAFDHGVQADARGRVVTQLLAELAADTVADPGFVGGKVEFAHAWAPLKKVAQPSTAKQASSGRQLTRPNAD